MYLENISLRIPYPNAYRDQGSALNHANAPFLDNRVERTVTIWREYAPSQVTVIRRAGTMLTDLWIFQEKLKTRTAR